MSLFVCNATPRDHHLNYRLPGDERVYDRIIKAGTQFKVLHEDPDQESAIVKQLESYGAVPVSRVNDKHFSGLIFSSKAIQLDDIRNGLMQIDQNAIQRALDHRTAAAVGSDANLAKTAQEVGATGSSFEVSITEQARAGVATEDLQKNTIEVVREGGTKAAKKRAGRRG